MLGDGTLSPGRAGPIPSSDFLREPFHILMISSLRYLCAPTRSGCTGRRIRDAGGLSGFESLLLDEEALAFIATPGSAPL
jgi:hypothetical protein